MLWIPFISKHYLECHSFYERVIILEGWVCFILQDVLLTGMENAWAWLQREREIFCWTGKHLSIMAKPDEESSFLMVLNAFNYEQLVYYIKFTLILGLLVIIYKPYKLWNQLLWALLYYLFNSFHNLFTFSTLPSYNYFWQHWELLQLNIV